MGMTLGEVLSLRHNNQNQAVKIDVLKMDVNAKDARIAELKAALKEVHRRTGLLMTQNQGRWNMSLEHDRRTADVLSVNQDISSAAYLGETNGT